MTNFILKYSSAKIADKDKELNEKSRLIFLIYFFNGQRFKYSTGWKIDPKDWNPKEHRARKGYIELNRFLDKLDRSIKDIHLKLLTDEVPVTRAILKEELDRLLQKKTKVEIFIQFIARFIEQSTHKATSKTIFNTVFGHLKDYPGPKNFSDITAKWFENYSIYLQSKNFSKNYIGKNITTIKQFLNEAAEQKVSKLTDYKSKRFKKPSEEATTIYLTVDELTKIKNAALTPAQDRVRDLFLVGAFTGLRYSDFSKLVPANIENGLIRIRQQKTGDPVVIPVHPLVQEILNKYAGDLPDPISNQKMNKVLKKIAEIAELKDKVIHTRTTGGKVVKTELFKYQLVTCHTARRSFASNAYLAGIPELSIRRITGHKTESSFLKYVKITGEQNALLLSDHPFFKSV